MKKEITLQDVLNEIKSVKEDFGNKLESEIKSVKEDFGNKLESEIKSVKEDFGNKLESEIGKLAAYTKIGFDEATKERAELFQKTAELEYGLKELKTESARIEKKIDKKSAQLEKKIDKESTRLEKKIDGTAEVFYTAMHNSEKRILDKISEMQKEIKELNIRVSRLEKLSKKHSQDLEKIKKDLIAVKQKIKLQKDVFAAKKELKKIEMRICALEVKN